VIVATRSVGMFDVSRIADELRFVLRRFAAEKAVEILEAVTRGPIIEGTGGGSVLGRGVMPLAPSGGAVAVVFEYLGGGGTALGDDAQVSVPIIRQLADLPVANAMMIATRQQRRAGWRAHRGSVKPIVGNSLVGDRGQSRCVNFAAVSVRLRRPDVIDEHDENVRRILWQMIHWWERT